MISPTRRLLSISFTMALAAGCAGDDSDSSREVDAFDTQPMFRQLVDDEEEEIKDVAIPEGNPARPAHESRATCCTPAAYPASVPTVTQTGSGATTMSALSFGHSSHEWYDDDEKHIPGPDHAIAASGDDSDSWAFQRALFLSSCQNSPSRSRQAYFFSSELGLKGEPRMFEIAYYVLTKRTREGLYSVRCNFVVSDQTPDNEDRVHAVTAVVRAFSNWIKQSSVLDPIVGELIHAVLPAGAQLVPGIKLIAVLTLQGASVDAVLLDQLGVALKTDAGDVTVSHLDIRETNVLQCTDADRSRARAQFPRLEQLITSTGMYSVKQIVPKGQKQKRGGKQSTRLSATR